ncbi:MAG: nucleoside-diphosphate kinase [Thermodesulfovibrionia bacterium]|nr:nucleoside-diphosphate kinase [Thermodesulfovibrionia bacterium]
MYRYSLVLIKPDAIRRKLCGEIISTYEKEGLDICSIKIIQMDREIAEGFYHVHKGKEFFQRLINFMVSAPTIAMVIGGNDAIKKIREINGLTDPKEAGEDTIRGKWALDVTRNSVHASDSPESAESEIAYFFPAFEILKYEGA